MKVKELYVYTQGNDVFVGKRYGYLKINDDINFIKMFRLKNE